MQSSAYCTVLILLKDRYMEYNIRLVEDIIEYYEHKQKKGLLFMADFSKGFDTLEWEFMFKTLDLFNFGTSFKQWIRTIYEQPVCKM